MKGPRAHGQKEWFNCTEFLVRLNHVSATKVFGAPVELRACETDQRQATDSCIAIGSILGSCTALALVLELELELKHIYTFEQP